VGAEGDARTIKAGWTRPKPAGRAANQTGLGVLRPPPQERQAAMVLQDLRGRVPAKLPPQTPRGQARPGQAPAGAPQRGQGEAHVRPVAAVVRGSRPQVPSLRAYGRTARRGPRNTAISRRRRFHIQYPTTVRHLQQHEGQRDRRLPRGICNGG